MNIGLIMIIIGALFGIVGLICLIMGVRSGRKKNDYNVNNYNAQNSQPMSNNHFDNSGNYQNSYPSDNGVNNGESESDWNSNDGQNNGFSNGRNIVMASGHNGKNMGSFDPFNDEPVNQSIPKNNYDNEDFDPFADIPTDIQKDIKPIKQSFSVPKMPRFKDDVDSFKNSKVQDLGDFDTGMSYDDNGIRPKNIKIDLDEDLEDF